MRTLILLALLGFCGCSDSNDSSNNNTSMDAGNLTDAHLDAQSNDANGIDAENDEGIDSAEADTADMAPEAMWISGDPSTLNDCNAVCESAGFLCEEGTTFFDGGGLRADYDDDSELVLSCDDLPPATTSTFDGMGTTNLVAYSCRCVVQ